MQIESRNRSYSDPLPREFTCVACGNIYKVCRDVAKVTPKVYLCCSNECQDAIEEKRQQKLKRKAKELIHIFVEKMEQKSKRD